MRWERTVLALGLAWMAAGAAAQELVPFVLPWDDGSPGPTDVSGWLHKPAGKFGPVQVGKDGHLYVGQERVRFLGVNLCFGACFPSHEDAERIAARMAKFGINCVRFHHMDSRTFPDGIRARNLPHTRALDPEALDRLDYLIAQLKRNGIYVNLNLLVSRPFVAADGLPKEIEEMDWKDRHVVGFFHAPMLELQKEYARQLLTHRNPYTDTSYAQEPAVAFVEINNENGLLHAWLGGRVDRMPAVFQQDLQRQWNEWLRRRYGSTQDLRQAWGVREEPLGPELLRNNDWSKGTEGWVLERHGGAEAEMAIVPEGPQGASAVRIQVRRLGTAAWHVQFNQPGLRVEADRPYTLTFWAKADAPGEVSVSVGQAHEPWQHLGFSTSVRLTSEWQPFRFTFLLNQGDANARVHFSNLGQRTGTYWLAGISFRPGGVVGLHPQESLEAGTLPPFLRARFGERTREAQGDWIRFLWETERNYWQSMYRYLKEDLGVRALVVGTIVGCSTPNLMAELDAVDTHAYWQHPQFPVRPWDPENWLVRNVSMVNVPGGVLAGLAQRRVMGKPHLCTEYNHPAPNTYSSEAPLLLAALAGLQDWDGVFLFAYSHRRDAWDMRRIPNFFDIDQHPLKMANLPIAAALFLRGDLSPARQAVEVALSPEEERERLRQEGSAWTLVHAGHLGVPGPVALLHRIALRVSPKPSAGATPTPKVEGQQRFVSDTGELVWDVSQPGKGVVTVNTPKTKVVVGFIGGRRFALGDVLIEPGPTRQDWCTVALSLLEGSSFAGPGRALVVATGYAENTHMGWKDETKSSVGRNWGEPPSLVEVVPVRILLPAPAQQVRLWALDERGQRAQEVPVQSQNGRALLALGPPQRTLWYEVVLGKVSPSPP